MSQKPTRPDLLASRARPTSSRSKSPNDPPPVPTLNVLRTVLPRRTPASMIASHAAFDFHWSVVVSSFRANMSHCRNITENDECNSARPTDSFARVSSHHVRSERVVGSFSTIPIERSVVCIWSREAKAGSRPGELWERSNSFIFVQVRNALQTILMPSGSSLLFATLRCVSVLFEPRPRPNERRYCLRSPKLFLLRSKLLSAVDVESMRARPEESSLRWPTLVAGEVQRLELSRYSRR